MSLQQQQNKGLEAFTGAATLILIKTLGFSHHAPCPRRESETRANQDDRQTLVLV